MRALISFHLAAKQWPRPRGLPSLFRQKLHPVNISNDSTDMAAFIITGCHSPWFSGLCREGLTAALGTPPALVRHPSSRGWGLTWCPRTQGKLSAAPLTPCSISLELLYSFNPALPNIWHSTGRYSRLNSSRQNQDIPLCVSLINLFWYPSLLPQESCVSPIAVFSTDSYHYGSASEKKCTVFQGNFLPIFLHCFLETSLS